mmetsp:Transcript_3707/g.11214  ORF Transcript_3707/g.11214 Transcript_3707/m.11214 type:complete len:350 (+) Transcript_3707:62-1111(+)
MRAQVRSSHPHMMRLQTAMRALNIGVAELKLRSGSPNSDRIHQDLGEGEGTHNRQLSLSRRLCERLLPILLRGCRRPTARLNCHEVALLGGQGETHARRSTGLLQRSPICGVRGREVRLRQEIHGDHGTLPKEPLPQRVSEDTRLPEHLRHAALGREGIDDDSIIGSSPTSELLRAGHGEGGPVAGGDVQTGARLEGHVLASCLNNTRFQLNDVHVAAWKCLREEGRHRTGAKTHAEDAHDLLGKRLIALLPLQQPRRRLPPSCRFQHRCSNGSEGGQRCSNERAVVGEGQHFLQQLQATVWQYADLRHALQVLGALLEAHDAPLLPGVPGRARRHHGRARHVRVPRHP